MLSGMARQYCVLPAGLLLMLMSTSALAAATTNQVSCARPGYVFLECQEPSIFGSSDRIIGSQGGLSTDRLQQQCDQNPSCIAFSTDGMLVKANPDTGKAGPFQNMNRCAASGSQGLSLWQWLRSSFPKCRGTYVFDGTVTQVSNTPEQPQQQDSSVPTPVGAPAAQVNQPGGTTTINGAPAPAPTAVAVAHATSVQGQLSGTYMRGQSYGGGKIGRAVCVLC